MKQELKKKRYREACLSHNNKSLLILAMFLLIEQLCYGLVFTDSGTLIAKAHLWTAGASGLYTLGLSAIFIENKKGVKYTRWKEIFQFSYLVLLLSVSVYRAVYIPSTDFSIPAIYIAMIYGSAFLFYTAPPWSAFLYGSTLGAFIYLSIYENHGLIYATFVQDIIVNNFLAWVGSWIAYKRFVQHIDSSIMIEAQNDELLRLSRTDCLTQLSNRRQIDKSLEEIHGQAQSTGGVYSVILADIDQFKQVNDQFGHGIGDIVLVEVTSVFKASVPDGYILGRWGGEEFMIICIDTGIEEAYGIAETLRLAVEGHEFSLERQITCSFGIATYSEGLNIHQVVRNADEALYASKENGRNLVTLSK